MYKRWTRLGGKHIGGPPVYRESSRFPNALRRFDIHDRRSKIPGRVRPDGLFLLPPGGFNNRRCNDDSMKIDTGN